MIARLNAVDVATCIFDSQPHSVFASCSTLYSKPTKYGKLTCMYKFVNDILRAGTSHETKVLN